MKKNQLIIFAYLFSISTLFAQNTEVWDLKRCIEYAQQENLQVAQSQWNGLYWRTDGRRRLF